VPSNEVTVTTTSPVTPDLTAPTVTVDTAKTRENSVTLTWATVSGALGYEVQYRSGTSGEWHDADNKITFAAGKASITVTSLEHSTQYQFQVCSVFTEGHSDYSTPVSETTKPPFKPETDETKTNSVTVSWDKDTLPEGDVFQYKSKSGGDWVTWGGKHAGDSITIPGLLAGEYETRWKTAEGDFVDTGTITVAASDGTAPTALKPKVKAGKKGTEEATTINSITLMLTDHRNATAESNVRYVITCSVKVGKNWTEIERISTSDDKYTFTGLKPNTSYKFTITAVNAQGKQTNDKGKDVSVTKTMKTAKYAAVSKVKAFKDGDDVKLTWTTPKKPAPGAEYTAYEIVWLNGKNDKEGTPVPIVEGSLTQSGNSWSAKFEYTAELKALGKKTFAVRAVTLVGGEALYSLDGKVTINPAKLV
jgi:hypothetical protein